MRIHPPYFDVKTSISHHLAAEERWPVGGIDNENSEFNSQIRVCQKCCWWASVCGKRPVCSSTARRSTESPDGCTSASASPDRLFRQPANWSSGTCSGSRRRQRCPSSRCTCIDTPSRSPSPWMEETSAFTNDNRCGITTCNYELRTQLESPRRRSP